MPTIHVVYDPNSKITGMTPEMLKSIDASAIVMQIADNITMTNLDTTIRQCIELVLYQIALEE